MALAISLALFLRALTALALGSSVIGLRHIFCERNIVGPHYTIQSFRYDAVKFYNIQSLIYDTVKFSSEFYSIQ